MLKYSSLYHALILFRRARILHFILVAHMENEMKNNATRSSKIVNRLSKKSSRYGISISSGLFVVLFFFQNCSQGGKIAVSKAGIDNATSAVTDSPLGASDPKGPDLAVCSGLSCSLEPITEKVAVTTILLALGDEVDKQLVIGGGSSQLIAETVVRYTTPVRNPRILVVHDHGSGGESAYDTQYVMKVLLFRYNPTFLEEPDRGLTLNDLEGYDLVWFNNPGNPMTTKASMESLVGFKGGVVLQGDDLSWGRDFSMQSLTHAKNIDNGTDVRCQDGHTYHLDNNTGLQYRVTMDPEKMPTPNSESLKFNYGNDIDLVSLAGTDVDVLATAQGGPENCGDERATIFRYFKN